MLARLYSPTHPIHTSNEHTQLNWKFDFFLRSSQTLCRSFLILSLSSLILFFFSWWLVTLLYYFSIVCSLSFGRIASYSKFRFNELVLWLNWSHVPYWISLLFGSLQLVLNFQLNSHMTQLRKRFGCWFFFLLSRLPNKRKKIDQMCKRLVTRLSIIWHLEWRVNERPRTSWEKLISRIPIKFNDSNVPQKWMQPVFASSNYK